MADGRWSYDHSPKDHPLTLSARCRMCRRHSVLLFSGSDTGFYPPQGCPRERGELESGATTECPECEAFRTEVERRRRGGVGDEELGSLFIGHLTRQLQHRQNKAEFGPAFFDLSAKAEEEAFLEDLTQALDPTRKMLEDARTGKAVVWVAASELMKELLGVVWADETFTADRARNADTWAIDQHLLEWLRSTEWLASQEAVSTADQLARTWAFLFTAMPLGSRAWTRWTFERRAEVLEAWRGLFERRAGVSRQLSAVSGSEA